MNIIFTPHAESPFTKFFQEQMRHATDDLKWEVMDEIDNAHLGPSHRPNRGDYMRAQDTERNRAALRSMGRTRGPYRRV